MKKIVFTGGGTAGHVTPNIAIMDQLGEQDYEFHYIGSHDGIEKDIVKAKGNIFYHPIRCGKLRRYLSMENFKDIFRIIGGYFDAKRVIAEIKPDLLFSKGGFVSVPAVFAAHNKGIPVISHESDLTPGLANRLTKGFSKYICTTFPDTLTYIKPPKGIETGAPVRAELFNGNAEKAREWLGFDQKPVLLMMGGSIGARAINETLRASLPQLLPNMNVIHLCGKGNLDQSLASLQGYKQFEYINTELPDIMALADYVLSRAGSNAINEFLALHKPMLLIPLPLSASRGDQILNAESFRKRGFALVLEQEKMNSNTLCTALNELISRHDELLKNMQANAVCNGTVIIADLIRKNIGNS